MSTPARRWKAPAACCRIDKPKLNYAWLRWLSTVTPLCLPASPSRGEISFGVHCTGDAKAEASSPPLRGRWPAGRGGPRSMLSVSLFSCLLPLRRRSRTKTLQGRSLRLSGHALVRQTTAPTRSSTIARCATSTTATRCRKRRVHAQYTDTGVRKVQQDLLLKTDAGDVRHVAVGKTEGAGIIVLYLHGQGGSRKQGVDDFTFGGNFNRIKNLMAGNGGLYLSPGFHRFRRQGRGPGRGADRPLCRSSRRARRSSSPAARWAARCAGSLPAATIRAAHRRAAAARLAVGRQLSSQALPSSAMCRCSSARAARTRSFPWRSRKPSSAPSSPSRKTYPTRFVRFETGTHGTPIRMIDWRGTLNWMLSKAP